MASERPSWLEWPLFALCAGAPLAIGGVHVGTQLVLASVSLLLFLVAGLGPLSRRGVRIPPLGWVMIAAFAYTALQLLPLPASVVGVLSPSALQLRSGLDEHALFLSLTLDRPSTALELVKQLGYLCVFLAGAELLRRDGGARRVAAGLAWFGGGMAALVAIHRVLGVQKIYGLYTLQSIPGSGFFAPFVNGNNAASLLVLCAIAAFGMAAMGRQLERVVFIACGTAATATALYTGSRGGAIGLAVGVFVLVTLLASAHFGMARGLLLSVGVVLVLGSGALFLADGLRARFVDERAGATRLDNQKTRGWQAALHLALRYPLTGVGRGAFEAPVAQERPDDEQVRLVYPENVVVQCLSEWGIPFGAGLMIAAALCLLRASQRLHFDASQAALAAGVIAVLVHELFDFALEFPGVGMPLCLALAALVGMAESDRQNRKRPRVRLRRISLVLTGVVGITILAAGIAVAPHILAEDLALLQRRVTEQDPNAAAALEAALHRHPASAELEMLAGADALQRRDPTALRHLNRAMWLQPAAGRPHLLAAIELRRLGRVRQAALEYRLASERGAEIDRYLLISRLGRAVVDAVPITVDSYLELGDQLASHNHVEVAELAFARAAELDSTSRSRVARLMAMPPGHKLAAAEAVEKEAEDGEELALAVLAYVEAKEVARAEVALRRGLVKFPSSARLAIAASKLAEARGDLDGAREALGRSARFDHAGRILVEQRILELAEKSHDEDSAGAARARLRLLSVGH